MDGETYRKEKVYGYLERARQALASGDLLLQHGDYNAAVNRAYYAFFYSATALLATKGLERSKHSGVLSTFRQHFAKTGLIAEELSDFYGQALNARHLADYSADVIGLQEAEENLENAKRFVNQIDLIMSNSGKES